MKNFWNAIYIVATPIMLFSAAQINWKPTGMFFPCRVLTSQSIIPLVIAVIGLCLVILSYHKTDTVAD